MTNNINRYVPRLQNVENIIKYSKMSYSKLIKLNRETNYPAYSGRLTKLQLIYQLTFLRDAPDEA